MPGSDAAYGGGALYPKDQQEHQELLTWALEAFQAADSERAPYVDKWHRFYKLYRSHIDRDPTDWRSKVFVPASFWIVETVLPRLIAQLPKPLVFPVSPEDEEPAKTMEEVLDYAGDKSGLEVELIEGFKSAMIYGTGILRVFYWNEPVPRIEQQPVMEEVPETYEQVVVDPETGLPLPDLNGEEMVETHEITTEQPTGEYRAVRVMVPPPYDGPKAEFVDLENFWVSREATDLGDARYAIERHERDLEYLKRRLEEDAYRLPEGMTLESLVGQMDEPAKERMGEVGLQGSDSQADATRKPIELLVFWTHDGRVLTVANRKAILRHDYHPYLHGELPYCKIVDHPIPGEFYGVGEVETVEGLQDVQNALVNLRIDNGKLALSPTAVVNETKLKDAADLVVRPGGVVRVNGQVGNVDEVVKWLEMPSVPYSAFEEMAEVERFMEKTTGVTGYQMGTDAPSLNDTATGVAIIQEQGANRFAAKLKLAEVTALRRLYRQFGAIIQQFWTEEKPLRLKGQRGQVLWSTLDPTSLQGSFDYDIESGSSVQTESIRREQAIALFDRLLPTFAPITVPVIDPATGQPVVDPMTGQPMMQQQEHPGVTALKEDLLEAFGKKDTARYLAAEEEEPEEAVTDQGVPPELLASQMGMPVQ